MSCIQLVGILWEVILTRSITAWSNRWSQNAPWRSVQSESHGQYRVADQTTVNIVNIMNVAERVDSINRLLACTLQEYRPGTGPSLQSLWVTALAVT